PDLMAANFASEHARASGHDSGYRIHAFEQYSTGSARSMQALACVACGWRRKYPQMVTATHPDRSGEIRLLARHIFLHTLYQCSVAVDFSRHVRYECGARRVCDDLYTLTDYDHIS